MYFDESKDNTIPPDRLDRQSLPPSLEEAEAEYFADMAFDDRLLLALQKRNPKIIITLAHTVTSHQDGIASRYFTSNTTESHDITLDKDTVETIEQPAFSFTLQGMLSRQPDHIKLHCVILPEDASATRITLQDTVDNNDLFYLSKQEKDGKIDVDLIDSKELLALLFQLSGVNLQSVNDFYSSLSQIDQDKASLIHAHIENFWGQFADTHGRKEVIHQIIHEVKTPALTEHPETITLTRKEIEEPQRTLVELNIEHTTNMPELHAEEAYCLQLSFEHATQQSIKKNAEKIIRSTDSPRLVGLTFYRKNSGRITQLDISDVKVKELFVNWFDQVIST